VESDPEPPRVAVVLPGGGARGAYEAGALSVLLPALEARGERVTVFCGTSVGAINAALLASVAQLPAGEAVEAMLGQWRGMRKRDVMNPIVGPGLAISALRLLGEALEVPGLRLGSLLDASPLRRSIERWIDWPALHRNVASGTVDAVSVVATALSCGSSIAFVESRHAAPHSRAGDELRYVPVALTGEHVRASAAIPLLFAPVEVSAPASARDHYIDGGTRLNSPLKPALALGADRVIVVGFEPFGRRARPPVAAVAPHMTDVIANILDGLLVDQVGDDLHRMAAINSFFVHGASRAARDYRAVRGRSPYRRIAYALVAPARGGELGRIAERVFRERYSGIAGLLRSPDYPLISRVLGGRTRSRGELLSFLLFDEVFVEALIGAGQRDARRWLRRHPRLWSSEGARSLVAQEGDRARLADLHALDEYRESRRH
jgi:NTE family protein